MKTKQIVKSWLNVEDTGFVSFLGAYLLLCLRVCLSVCFYLSACLSVMRYVSFYSLNGSSFMNMRDAKTNPYIDKGTFALRYMIVCQCVMKG